jgi:hypothetical protein
MKNFAHSLAYFLLGVFFSMGVSNSQVITATLVGRVTDQTNAVVPGVTITILNQSTGFKRSVLSDSNGDYVLASIPAGNYQVTAELTGFKKALFNDISLQVDQTPRLDIRLTVGESNQELEVTAAVPTIKTDTSDIGMVVSNQQLIDIPLNGRKLLDLNLLDSAASRVSNFRNDPASARSQNLGLANVSFNGSSSDGNVYLVDGIQSEGLQTTHMTYQPTLESVAEFKQQSNQYDATSGFGGGAQINIITKSGTNTYHGELYEFIRNDKFDSRNFFDNKKPEYRQNQFGGVLGGKVIKDHTFFLVSIEGIRVRQASTSLFSVPSAAQGAGNFGGTATIYDPNTTRPDPSNAGQFLRDPFPANIIPSARIDPAAGKVISMLFPAPNLPGNSANLLAAPLRTENSAEYSFRGDHQFNANHSIFGRYTKFTNEKILGASAGFTALPNDFDFVNNPASNLTFGYTAVLSSRTVNDLRVGWSTWNQVLEETTGRLGANIDYHKVLGLDPLCSCDQNIATGLPRFNIAGFGYTGGNINAPNNRNDNNYQFADNFSVNRGNHQFAFGATLRLWREDGAGVAPSVRGNYAFTARYTTLPGAANTGNALADFLLGYPSTTTIGSGVAYHDYNRNLLGGYAQDNWKVLPNLTLNLGLRWEYFGPWHDPQKSLTFFDFKTGTIVPTQDIINEGLGSSGYTVNKDNIAPRVGFAWRPFGNNSTSVRAGFGMFHLPHQDLYLNFGSNKSPLYQLLTFNADPITPNLTLENAFPPALGAGTITATAIQPHWKTPYNIQWSLFIQHELARNLSVEAGYVGNRGVDLEQSPNINTPLPGPGALNSRRLYPAYGSISESQSLGDSWYHALQFNLERKWTNGFSFRVSYAFSKGLSDTDLGNFAFQGGTGVKGNPFTLGKTNKGRTEFDARHRLALSYIYEFPYGRSKRYGAKAPAVVDAFLGGWQVNGLTTISTGTPIDTTLAVDNAGTGGGGSDDRPNLIGNPNNGPKTAQQWFNTAAFALGPAGRYGNAARNVITAPGISNFDFSLFKNFRLTERHNLQFRAEFFNGFNHTQFDPPNTVFGTATFGRVLSAGDGRQIQLALKYKF